MKYTLPLFIGARLTRAKRSNVFISFISLASLLGIAIGVMALVTVLSVMNGFDHEIKQRLLILIPHVTLTEWPDVTNSKLPQVAKVLADYPEIKGVQPFVDGQVMFMRDGQTQGGMIQGIQPEQINQVLDIPKYITKGKLNSLAPQQFNIIAGEGLLNRLGLSIGDKLTVIVPRASTSPFGAVPKMKQFTITASFKVGYMYDNYMAFIHLEDARKLLQVKTPYTQLKIKLASYLAAPRVKNELLNTLPMQIRVTDWTDANANYFHAVKMEKTLMFLILTLIIAVAAFNLVSTLVMMVNEKTKDIAILRTMGATGTTIVCIFMMIGSLIGIVGTLIGVGGGTYLALHITQFVTWLELHLHTQLLSKDVYFISFLPSKLILKDVVMVSTVSILLSIIAAIYPAFRAQKIQPAEALRYE